MDRDLRKMAEERMKSSGPAREELQKDSQIIHDLQVYQIELEIQNEELRHTEGILQKAKDDYMRLYDQAPVGYITVDRSTIITRCNRTFMEMTGRDPVGKSFHTLIDDADKDLFLARFKAFFNKPEEKDIELNLTGQEGPFPVRLSGQREAPSDDDEEEQLLIILQDITEQKKVEQEKEVLLKEIHHRVKNNMNTIMSLLSLQASMQKESGAVTALQEARERVATMLLIYNSLFRSEKYHSVHMKEYLQDLIYRIASTYKREGLTISLDTSIADLELPSSEAFNLGIIINELVTNAFKYAFPHRDTGTITITLDEPTQHEGTCTTRLEIADNGCGFDPETRESVSGGFGLTLVESLVNHFNGELLVQALNPGSSFSMVMDIDCL